MNRESQIASPPEPQNADPKRENRPKSDAPWATESKDLKEQKTPGSIRAPSRASFDLTLQPDFLRSAKFTKYPRLPIQYFRGTTDRYLTGGLTHVQKEK